MFKENYDYWPEKKGRKSRREENLKKNEGEMFDSPYGEQDYNIPGHEDKERLKCKNSFIKPEDVIDESAEQAIYEQAETDFGKKKVKETQNYDAEKEFISQAVKILDPKEFRRLFEFLESLDKEEHREYIGHSDDIGFIEPTKSLPRDITDLIRKVNNQRRVIEATEFDKKGSPGKTIKVPADSVRFKVKETGAKIEIERAKKQVA